MQDTTVALKSGTIKLIQAVTIALSLSLMTLPALAGLEDILYESGKITKDEWVKAKADREQEQAAIEKQASAAMKGVGAWADKKKTWIDSVTWSGDLRLRYEQFWRYGTDAAVDRIRERFRLRFGPEIKMGDFKVNIQIGSSQSTDGINGDQVSHNQTFDNAFSQKEIFILRAYGSWNPSFFKPMTLYGGKMRNLFYTQYTNDLLFDADVNPEGLQQNFTFKATDNISLFGNFGQFALDEDNTGGKDQYMFGFQGGTETKLGDTKLRLAVGYFDMINSRVGGISEPTLQQFNSRTAAAPSNATAYVNDYNVLQLSGGLEFGMLGYPIAILGDYVKNTSGVITCSNNAGNRTGACGATAVRYEDQDQGYQAGVIIGKASKAKTWEVAYFYKWLQADAVLSAFADSDFGDGGTNRRGNIFWVGYSFTDFLNFRVKFFNTKPLVRTLCGTNSSCRDSIDRLQVDMVWNF